MGKLRTVYHTMGPDRLRRRISASYVFVTALTVLTRYLFLQIVLGCTKMRQ